jgi:hypothetical protein
MPRLQSEFFKKCKYDRDEFDGAWSFLSPLTISQKNSYKISQIPYEDKTLV